MRVGVSEISVMITAILAISRAPDSNGHHIFGCDRRRICPPTG
jgi:hypothetical protein